MGGQRTQRERLRERERERERETLNHSFSHTHTHDTHTPVCEAEMERRVTLMVLRIDARTSSEESFDQILVPVLTQGLELSHNLYPTPDTLHPIPSIVHPTPQALRPIYRVRDTGRGTYGERGRAKCFSSNGH